MDGGLPYDADDSGPTRVPDMDGDHPMLDKALDDYTVPVSATGSHFGFHERSVVSEHAANLLGRMGRSKVYLAEESPGIIHHDAEERLRRDPVSPAVLLGPVKCPSGKGGKHESDTQALARLAQELDKQDPTSWLGLLLLSVGTDHRCHLRDVVITYKAECTVRLVYPDQTSVYGQGVHVDESGWSCCHG